MSATRRPPALTRPTEHRRRSHAARRSPQSHFAGRSFCCLLQLECDDQVAVQRQTCTHYMNSSSTARPTFLRHYTEKCEAPSPHTQGRASPKSNRGNICKRFRGSSRAGGSCPGHDAQFTFPMFTSYPRLSILCVQRVAWGTRTLGRRRGSRVLACCASRWQQDRVLVSRLPPSTQPKRGDASRMTLQSRKTKDASCSMRSHHLCHENQS